MRNFIDIEDIVHPYFGTSLSNWLHLLWENKGVDIKVIPYALVITLVIVILSPARYITNIILKSRIRKIEVKPSPIFIMGHWRSGTTFLHNLISSSGKFGYINTFESFFPDFSLFVRGEKSLFGRFARKTTIKRLQDNVDVNVMDSPAEEETAIANKTHNSFYHGLIFRRAYKASFKKYMLIDNPAGEGVWKKNYENIMRQMTAVTDKRLLIKNPFNMTKIKLLLDLYPDAKFIYIYRNPYDVYLSTKNLHKKMAVKALQRIDEDVMNNFILDSYVKIMERFKRDVSLIPTGNITSVRYEDIECDPLGELQRVYKDIGLEDFENDKVHFQAYLDSVSNYKKNSYSDETAETEKISNVLGSFIKEMGYEIPVKQAIEN